MTTSSAPGSITVVGLGPGDPGALTRAAWEAICAAPLLYLRTTRHPTVAALPADLPRQSFDELYETADDFATVYQTIAETLLARAAAGDTVVYAVPGHPLVAESVTRRLISDAAARAVQIHVVDGLSFLEPVFSALQLDPFATGLQLIDALDLGESPHFPTDGPSWASLHDEAYVPPQTPYAIHSGRPVLICQLYSRAIASQVKLALLTRYPAAHPVTLVHAAGVVGGQQLRQLPLAELDHNDEMSYLSTLYVPALAPLENLRAPEGLRYVVERLLAPAGCPWDREQTHTSMRADLLEETYEVLEAIDNDDLEALAEELGDLLIAIHSHAEIGRQAGMFDLEDVYAGVASKLIRRHPHVFGGTDATTSGVVLANWDAIKRAERQAKGAAPRGALDGVPPALPALASAQKIATRAARVGFDAPDLAGIWALVDEEFAELRAATAGDARRAEFGDLLFALANLARRLDIDGESALREAVGRFQVRFGAMEQHLAQRGQSLGDLEPAARQALWDASPSPR